VQEHVKTGKIYQDASARFCRPEARGGREGTASQEHYSLQYLVFLGELPLCTYN
jgi:hypothetical protein